MNMNLNSMPADAMQDLASLGASLGIDTNIQFEQSGKTGVLQMSNTGSQHVTFEWMQFRNPFETNKKIAEKKAAADFTPTYPVYDKVLIVNIHTAGQKEPFIGRAEDYHKQTYFPQYKRFLDGKSQIIGTPIEKAEFLMGPEAMELRARGVQTIEQLAASGDVLCEVLPRGYEIRDLARMEMQLIKENTVGDAAKKLSAELHSANDKITALHKENARRDEEMEEMRKILQQMSYGVNVPILELNAAEDPTVDIKRGPGRPKANV